jgi:putative ATPase
MIEGGKISSMILWGPPGVGKTSLANLIANYLNKPFHQLSAISSGVKDIREVILKSKGESNPILFIDEIHRFSKSQQDSLLGAVEQGVVTLIGATTENPSFEVISPLLSRCQVYVLEELSKSELDQLCDRAIQYYSKQNIELKIEENDALYRFSGGDARKLYNAIDLMVNNCTIEGKCNIKNESLGKIIQENMARFDKSGEMHYDIASAFIKSMRNSDPNASLYWMARLIEGGEKPEFIARRMLILAAEDIGLANPNALLLANTAFDAIHKIGWPEARIILGECAVYLASSPKSNSAYSGIDAALAEVRKSGDLPVPLHLRNAPSKLMKDLNYGKDYKYAHSFDGNFTIQECLPDKINNLKLYDPGNNSRENETRKQLKKWWGDKYGY